MWWDVPKQYIVEISGVPAAAGGSHGWIIRHRVGVLPWKVALCSLRLLSCRFQNSEIPPESAWRCRSWGNWEISRAASWALQIGKNYLILGSRSRHPLVILSIKQMELILIINEELFAGVVINGGNGKKHSTFMMQKYCLSLNISSGISFGSIKKYFWKYIF